MRTPKYWVLNEQHIAVPTDDIHEWGRMWDDESKARRVAADDVNGYWVSTMFMGMDLSFGDSQPLLFETMVFGASMDENYVDRYETWDQAVIGHAKAVEWAKTQPRGDR
jgi:hypothetical protein